MYIKNNINPIHLYLKSKNLKFESLNGEWSEWIENLIIKIWIPLKVFKK